VATIRNKRVNKAGDPVEYVSHLVRRNYREGKKVKHETMADLSSLPADAIDAVRSVLSGEAPASVPADKLQIRRSVPHGHVAAVVAQAKQVGLPALVERASRRRDIAFALVLARVLQPESKLATTRWCEASLV